MSEFVVSECNEYGIIRELFLEYSKIKGAESCFVSFGNELDHLESFYSGGALLVGYENGSTVGCIAIRKVDEKTCEAKRLFIKPMYRGKGYARLLLESMLSKARELGLATVSLTTKPSVMPVAYGLYERMGFRELSEDAGTVRMTKDLQIEQC